MNYVQNANKDIYIYKFVDGWIGICDQHLLI